jgi:hypothetical protein
MVSYAYLMIASDLCVATTAVAARWTQELLADKALVALTALKKKLESDPRSWGGRGTRLEKPCGRLEVVGIVLLSSGRGDGVILVRQETRKPDEEA